MVTKPSRQNVALRTLAINIRIASDVTSCLSLRLIAAVGELRSASVALGSLETGGGYLRRVEGNSAGVIRHADAASAVTRQAARHQVLAVDAPHALGLEASMGAIIRSMSRSANDLGANVFAYQTVWGDGPTADQEELQSRFLQLGLPVHRVCAEQFDLMQTRSQYKITRVKEVPDDFLEQRGVPLLTYLREPLPDGERFALYLEAWIDLESKFMRALFR